MFVLHLQEVFQTETDLVKLEDVLVVCSVYCPDDDGTCSKAGHDLREMLDESEALHLIRYTSRRHGHWIKYVQFYDTVCTDVPMAECSDCRYITTQENLHNVSENGKELPDFCPCCGADMREDLKYREGD